MVERMLIEGIFSTIVLSSTTINYGIQLHIDAISNVKIE
ncbi:MAG: hypothetical protein RLY16_2544 [Bacteroidota bacterium]|jgi:hypothetical protein